MPSTINRTLPVQNSPMLSAEMRQQFGRAADDIDALQSGKAPLASPALTGTPTAPTAGTSVNNTQIATTAFAKAMPVTNLQGNPVSAGTPANGQVLAWGGSAWAPTPATGGAPDPATLAFRPLPSDLHNWIPPGTAGYFTAWWPGSPSLSNAPPGGGEWIFQGYSRSTGEQVIIARRPQPYFVDEPEYMKRRVTWSGGYWYAWQANPGRVWAAVRSRIITNFTVTSTPQMLPDFNLPYRPASRRHLYHFNTPIAYSGFRLWHWDAAYIPPGGDATLTGDYVDLNSSTVLSGNTARLVVDQSIGNVDVRTFATDDWEGSSNVIGDHLIYISRPAGNQTVELAVTIMALVENLVNVR